MNGCGLHQTNRFDCEGLGSSGGDEFGKMFAKLTPFLICASDPSFSFSLARSVSGFRFSSPPMKSLKKPLMRFLMRLNISLGNVRGTLCKRWAYCKKRRGEFQVDFLGD